MAEHRRRITQAECLDAVRRALDYFVRDAEEEGLDAVAEALGQAMAVIEAELRKRLA